MTDSIPVPDQRKLLGETVPVAVAFGGGNAPQPAHAPSAIAESPDVPRLAGIGLSGRLSGNATARRYEIKQVLGAGSTGCVYLVEDGNLERQIAVKLLKTSGDGSPSGDDTASFVEEARVTAALKHPNVMPVYDLDMTDGGEPYFSMGKIEGCSLGQAIAQSTASTRAALIATPNDIVNIFVGVCHALSFAHSKGIVHQDIKPDNILLGEFGEVLLLDWGSATRERDRGKQKLYGTPLFMSPEQARREGVDALSDVYSLGATMFNALTLRFATWSDDPDLFWAKKQRGELDLPTREELASSPVQLLDIALKALAAKPEERYPSVEALLKDLQHYQAGMAISAHRDSVWEKLARLYRLNRRAIWVGTLTGMVVLSLVAALYGERLKEMATWGAPVTSEDFADESWRSRWLINNGGFEARDGKIVTTGKDGNVIVYDQRLSGPTAIEFDGEELAGAHLGDLSVFWCNDITVDADTRLVSRLAGVIKCQFGAFDGSFSCIIGESTAHPLEYSPIHPERGGRYHVRVEIDDQRISLIVDGRQVCEHTDPFAFGSGYVAVYGYYPGKAFSNLRVYSRGVPEKVPATSIGDAFVQNEDYGHAAEQYAKVSASHRGTRIGREALYKRGICAFRLGKKDEAFALWDGLRGSDYDDDVRMHDLDRLFDAKQHDQVITDLEQLYRRSGRTTRDRLAMQWTRFVAKLSAVDDLGLLARYLDLHDRVFPDQSETDLTVSGVLYVLGRYQEMLDRYPNLALKGCEALTALGHSQEIITRFPDQRMHVFLALESSGIADQIETRLPDLWPGAPLAMIEMGRAQEVLDRFPKIPYVRLCAWVSMGRIEQPLLEYPDDREVVNHVLLMQGRVQEAVTSDDVPIMMAQGRLDDALSVIHKETWRHKWDHWVRHARGLEAFIAADHARAYELFQVPKEGMFQQEHFDFAHFVMVPFLRELDGQNGALTRSCDEVIANYRFIYQQKTWHCSMYLAGKMSDTEFLAQPHRLFAEATLLLCGAIRLERAGQPTEALARYRAYLAMPLYRRGFDDDPVIDRFVSWRILTLGG